MQLTVNGPFFNDRFNRRVLLRGVNLGGSSKLPYPHADATSLSFVGRPFPLAEADTHFARLRRWGFNCLRLLTTWEAIEHAGPGHYDEAYLDYLYAIAQKAGEYDLWLCIDPHQDVWSRASGGDGAPQWTLELLGLVPERFDASEAAITPAGRQAGAYPYSSMLWPNNYSRLACATLFTLFFAGTRFAPDCRIEGVNIQDFLQEHFINAMRQVALRMAALPHVLGYDSLNAPSAGYIGLADLQARLPVYANAPQLTGLQSLALPAGIPGDAPFYTLHEGEHKAGRRIPLNAQAVSAWRTPAHDVWRHHGVWDLDRRGRPHLLRADYFAGADFVQDALLPFTTRYDAAMRAAHPSAWLFLETAPGTEERLTRPNTGIIVNTGHWYDVLTLQSSHYDMEATWVWGSQTLVRGAIEVRASYTAQIGARAAHSRTALANAPTLIGEFGLPFDLDAGAALTSGDYSPQIAALSAYYEALDTHLVHATLWNYTADNTHADGDGWNREDFSIFSLDDLHRASPNDPDAGGRAVRGFCRPSLQACAGTPTRQYFDPFTSAYSLELDQDPTCTAPTTVFVPRIHYPEGARIFVSSGEAQYDPGAQRLLWHGAAPGPQNLLITRRLGLGETGRLGKIGQRVLF